MWLCDFCFLRCRWHSVVFLTWQNLWLLGADITAVGSLGRWGWLGLAIALCLAWCNVPWWLWGLRRGTWPPPRSPLMLSVLALQMGVGFQPRVHSQSVFLCWAASMTSLGCEFLRLSGQASLEPWWSLRQGQHSAVLVKDSLTSCSIDTSW